MLDKIEAATAIPAPAACKPVNVAPAESEDVPDVQLVDMWRRKNEMGF